MPDQAAIVDPYSSGLLLRAGLASRGLVCVKVASRAEVPAAYRSTAGEESDFAAVVVHGGDVAETAEALRRRGVGLVLAGCEMGVELADALAERLGLPGNGTASSQARRDKAAMADRLSAAGVRTARGLADARLEPLLAWTREWNRWPVVLKPVASSGSDGVAFCASEEEVRQAFTDVAGRANLFDEPNRAVLVQERLRGTELVVDTVSGGGRHRAAAYWKYGPPADGSPVVGAGSIELMPAEGDLQAELLATAVLALDALGIRHGPAHCELMWSEEDGAAVVEVGARLAGGYLPTLSLLCCGTSQVELTLESYLEPERFARGAGTPYTLQASGRLVFLTPLGSGRLAGFPRLREIEALASCQEIHLARRRGPPLPRIAGWVRLIHAESEVVAADHRRIRELEAEGLYDIEEVEG